MNKRFLMIALPGIMAIFIAGWGCTKLDTTTLGSDLIPAVDNVNTFGTTLNVNAYQGIFNDTTRLAVADDKVLGVINNDPDFGKTKASVYAQFKPFTFPYSIAAAGDTLIAVDSVVLTLSYKSAWGDTSKLQQLTVREIPVNISGLYDSVYQSKRISYQPLPDNSGTNLLANNAPFQLVDVRQLGARVKFANGKDSTINQIRIRLSDTYANMLAKQDSARITRPGFLGNAFYNDSIFRNTFKGLAIESIAGESLLTINLTDALTRLEIHYRKRRNNMMDTTYTSLKVKPFTSPADPVFPSSVANYIARSNRPFIAPAPRVTTDEIYLQATPGTFAELVIPQLESFKDTNRIIHRAQLTITEVPGTFMPERFTPPGFLYLDLRDSTPSLLHKPIYFDLNPTLFYNPDNVPVNFYYPNEVAYGYFGGFAKKQIDPITGTSITYYDFNITRYLQRMVTQHSYNYELRLFAPYSFSYPQYGQRVFGYPNNLAYGRVKVGGTNGNYRMVLKIIWSKTTAQ